MNNEILKTSPGKVVVLMKFGSHLYGLNTPASDTDYKGIYIPTLDDVITGKAHGTKNITTGKNDSRNGVDDVDIDWISLPKFCSMVNRAEVISMDMLHANADVIMHETPVWRKLQLNKVASYSSDMAGYAGYVRQQAHKYGIKGSRLELAERLTKIITEHNLEKIVDVYLALDYYLDVKESEYIDGNVPDRKLVVFNKTFPFNTPVTDLLKSLEKIIKSAGGRAQLARDNEGVDWKAMSHALRVSYQLRDIFTKGTFRYPLDQTEYLKQVKLGQHRFESVSKELERMVDINNKSVYNSYLDFDWNGFANAVLRESIASEVMFDEDRSSPIEDFQMKQLEQRFQE